MTIECFSNLETFLIGEGAGRIFLADCGQRSYEEINLIVKGGNYGWSSREAHACYRSVPSSKIFKMFT